MRKSEGCLGRLRATNDVTYPIPTNAGVLMAKRRRVITDRQRRAARLLLSGWSGVRALQKAGFGRSYSRNLSRALNSSWGLREALREEALALDWQPSVRARRRRYDHRRVVRAIRESALCDEADVMPSLITADTFRKSSRSLENRARVCRICNREADELTVSYCELTGEFVPTCRRCAGPATRR
jgi:hypothetical protein